MSAAFMRDELTPKGERELEKRYRCPATGTKAVVHDIDIGMGSAHLGVYDNQSNSPVCDPAQHNQQEKSGKESSLAHGIRETWEYAQMR